MKAWYKRHKAVIKTAKAWIYLAAVLAAIFLFQLLIQYPLVGGIALFIIFAIAVIDTLRMEK
jgi:uncharacterized membrane protein YdcZ (DUF606 family)